MKNKGMRLIASFAIIALIAFATNVNAQFTKIGGGISYGTDDYPDLGLQAKGIFEINETIHISPSFTFFFPKDFFGIDVSGWSFDVDGHYVFVDSDFQVYGLAGLGLAGIKNKFLGNTISDTKIGLNLGIGGIKDFGSVSGFAELKFQAGAWEQLFLGAGVLFPL